ncbi:TRAP transporter substrate-binding protein DctP, partial [Vibrio breoganii]
GTQWELATSFSELMEQKTDGKVKIDLFPNGQLGNEQDTVNDAAIGLLDFSVLAINNVTPFSPTVGLLTMPYVIQSAEEAVLLTQGQVGQD